MALPAWILCISIQYSNYQAYLADLKSSANTSNCDQIYFVPKKWIAFILQHTLI